MKRIAIAISLLPVLVATAFAQASPQDEGRFAVAGLKEREVEVVFNSFKEAVAKDDKHKVAGDGIQGSVGQVVRRSNAER